MNYFRNKLYITTNPDVIKETTLLIQEVETAPGFTAMEYFDVNKGTVSTILGITITYCIILFQTFTC